VEQHDQRDRRAPHPIEGGNVRRRRHQNSNQLRSVGFINAARMRCDQRRFGIPVMRPHAAR
jgi:hypothetical protein